MIAEAQPFLVVEDDDRLRNLIGSVLCPRGWRALLVASGAEALAHFDERKERPLVALVDLGLPDMDGAELIQKMGAARPEVAVVVLTIRSDEQRLLGAIQAGARGFLFKDDLRRGLGPMLAEAATGGSPLSRAVARLILDKMRRDEPARDSMQRPALTERERQVVEQMARGYSYDQVATVLDIPPNTVRTHVRTLYEKLAVCTKTEAVLTAMRLGLVISARRSDA